MAAMIAASRGASAVIHLANIANEAPWPEILQVNIQDTYAASGRAEGELRLVQPRRRVRAAGELPGARLRVPRAGHLLRRGQGGGRGPGRPLPLPVRPGHDLYSRPDLHRDTPQRPGAVDLAVPGRRRPAVRGVPDRAGPGVPGHLRRLGQHPRRLGQPAGGAGARIHPPGRRRVVRGRGDRGVRRARSRRPGVPLPRRRVHPARPGRRDPRLRPSVRAWANLYPWDVAGDPAAADRIAGLGLAGVTLAAAYHSVRAVTPFHPQHRIVTRDAAVYYRADPANWRASRLRPARLRPAVARRAGSFERAAAALRDRGLKVTAWAVITHNDRLGAAVPSAAVRNAFGDGYPWALCPASPAVREYATTL